MVSRFTKMMTVGLMVLAYSIGWTQKTPWPEFYQQAPVIQVQDPMAYVVGSLPEGQLLTIHLTDVALYSGHVCPGIASGYILTLKALQALYPEGTPRRGQIRVAAMKASDLLDVASYITGARNFYGRDEVNAYDLMIDPGLNPGKPGEFIMVFQRKDTGKAVKAVFHKFKLMPPDQARAMKMFLGKMIEGRVSEKEKQEKLAKIQNLVQRILLNPPEGVFEIVPLENYQFPIHIEK